MNQEIAECLFDLALIEEVLYEVKSGKEATVYCCRAHPRTELELVAVKVYRDRRHRTFDNDAAYRDGEFIPTRRARLALRKKTDFGREVQRHSWLHREWTTMRALHAAGAVVPRPVGFSGEALVLEFIGDESGPAPRLKESRLDPADAPRLLAFMLDEVRRWLAVNIVHGDLSAYNILHWQGRLVTIDFPQACDPRFNANAASFLQRDVQALARFFRGYGAELDAEGHAAALWEEFLHARL